jgi:hypothetical protein
VREKKRTRAQQSASCSVACSSSKQWIEKPIDTGRHTSARTGGRKPPAGHGEIRVFSPKATGDSRALPAASPAWPWPGHGRSTRPQLAIAPRRACSGGLRAAAHPDPYRLRTAKKPLAPSAPARSRGGAAPCRARGRARRPCPECPGRRPARMPLVTSSDSSLTAFLFSGRGRRHGTVEASIDAFSTVEAGSVSYRNDANNGRVVVR